MIFNNRIILPGKNIIADKWSLFCYILFSINNQDCKMLIETEKYFRMSPEYIICMQRITQQ
jgi:hypothetical protein